MTESRKNKLQNNSSSKPSESTSNVILNQNKKASFHKTMYDIQKHMSPPERAFSKFIHIPIIELLSDILSKTIARPTAFLTGSLFAFVCTLFIYLIAKYYGYSLSGFESTGAFLLGWTIGNVFDYLKILVTGKK